jgi:malate synthase
MNLLTKITSLFKKQKQDSNEKTTESLSLTISNDLKDFLEREVLRGLDISKERFWSSFEKIINEFSPRNKALLQKREDLQSQIDAWHIEA